MIDESEVYIVRQSVGRQCDVSKYPFTIRVVGQFDIY